MGTRPPFPREDLIKQKGGILLHDGATCTRRNPWISRCPQNIWVQLGVHDKKQLREMWAGRGIVGGVLDEHHIATPATTIPFSSSPLIADSNPPPPYPPYPFPSPFISDNTAVLLPLPPPASRTFPLHSLHTHTRSSLTRRYGRCNIVDNTPVSLPRPPSPFPGAFASHTRTARARAVLDTARIE